METPVQSLFLADIAGAAFRAGVVKGRWGLADAGGQAGWPIVHFWIAAALREGAPDRFSLRLDLTGYRSRPPTGRFWDADNNCWLDFSRYPQGKPNSRFARVFRTDWGESQRAFYHPYDRVAADSHADWKQQLPHLVWTDDHTIVDYLEEFQSLLTSGDYLGVKKQ